MAENVIKSELKTYIFDIDTSRFNTLGHEHVHKCSSPRTVGDKADIIFTCLPSLETARSVVLDTQTGILGSSKVQSVVSLGTTGSAYATEISDQLQNNNISFLDSPISGGPAGAKAATLAMICSGDKQTYEKNEKEKKENEI